MMTKKNGMDEKIKELRAAARRRPIHEIYTQPLSLPFVLKDRGVYDDLYFAPDGYYYYMHGISVFFSNLSEDGMKNLVDRVIEDSRLKLFVGNCKTGKEYFSIEPLHPIVYEVNPVSMSSVEPVNMLIGGEKVMYRTEEEARDAANACMDKARFFDLTSVLNDTQKISWPLVLTGRRNDILKVELFLKRHLSDYVGCTVFIHGMLGRPLS